MKFARSVVVAVSHLRLLLRLGKVDKPAEPVRAALTAARPSDALGELQSGRHVPSREMRSFSPPYYRVAHHVSDLGWVDFDLGSSPGWWAAIVASYCPSRVVEHTKSKSTPPRSET